MDELREMVLSRLQGCVWHSTSADRFQGILKSGAILPEPDIPDMERYGTSQGRDWYPYVRTLGGVSLFDFRDFDPVLYSDTYRMNTWTEFVPYRSVWREAVWIEVDFSKLGNKFISGQALLDRCRSEGAGNRIMPKIEAAYLGSLPLSAFKSAFLVREGSRELPFADW